MNGATNISRQNWENASKVELLSLEPYRHLFPKATGKDWTVKRNAGVSHTVNFIPQAVKLCSWQVENFVNQELRYLPLEQACRKLWWWVRFHIQWVRDAENKEQVKSPRRLVSDGEGDCDCMTTFVDTSLSVYGVKKITNRIAAYDGNKNYSHIYSVVPLTGGKNIIIDCCYPQFNKEKEYTKKEDYTMDLQFLDGIEDTNNNRKYTDYEEDSDHAIMGEIGRLLKRSVNNRAGAFQKKSTEQKQAAKDNRQRVMHNAGKSAMKATNKVNKINPATAMLRAGILASMKLNILKVAERLKWAYATREQAASKGMDMSKYDRLKGVLTKAENLFFAAGGKPENLRKAIISGKGNQNKDLAGAYNYDESDSLGTLLGEVYLDEFVYGLDGMNSLGEPATAASITAAAGAMGALASLLASIGVLFPKHNQSKTNKPKQTRRAAKTNLNPEENREAANETNTNEAASAEEEPEQNEQEDIPKNSEADTSNENSSETEGTTKEEANGEDNSGETTEGLYGLLSGFKSYYEENKNWIRPAAFAGGGLIAGYLIRSIICKCKDKKKMNQSALEGLNEGGLNGEEANSASVIALM